MESAERVENDFMKTVTDDDGFLVDLDEYPDPTDSDLKSIPITPVVMPIPKKLSPNEIAHQNAKDKIYNRHGHRVKAHKDNQEMLNKQYSELAEVMEEYNLKLVSLRESQAKVVRCYNELESAFIARQLLLEECKSIMQAIKDMTSDNYNKLSTQQRISMANPHQWYTVRDELNRKLKQLG